MTRTLFVIGFLLASAATPALAQSWSTGDDCDDAAAAADPARAGFAAMDDVIATNVAPELRSFPVARPAAPLFAAQRDAALKSALADYVTRPQVIQLSYHDARHWLFAHSLDKRGYVWDAYGDREARTPGDSPVVTDINVEHTWPQSRFHTGWESEAHGRDDDPVKADLHNLYPTDENLNGERGNKPFGEVDGCDGRRACNAENLFEPPNDDKGNVARALFYFSVRYGLPIPEPMESTLKAWNRADPPDASEIARNDAIQGVQGNRNPFIDEPSLADRISDF